MINIDKCLNCQTSVCRHFSKIHVIDPRYYKGTISNYIKENNINHVLFLYNVKTIDEDLGILSIN